ncbi:MAG: hypothetical protein WBB26_04435 [Saprospiraceae bacterium]
MNLKKLIFIELLWWVSSLIVAAIFLIPIYFYKIPYPFYQSNFIFIVAFITFMRWLFLWQLTPYQRLQYLKAAFILVSASLVFYLIAFFTDFRVYVEDIGIQDMLTHLEDEDQVHLESYIRTEMLFFSIGSIICGICFPFRMVKSIWTQHNRDYV